MQAECIKGMRRVYTGCRCLVRDRQMSKRENGNLSRGEKLQIK